MKKYARFTKIKIKINHVRMIDPSRGLVLLIKDLPDLSYPISCTFIVFIDL